MFLSKWWHNDGAHVGDLHALKVASVQEMPASRPNGCWVVVGGWQARLSGDISFSLMVQAGAAVAFLGAHCCAALLCSTAVLLLAETLKKLLLLIPKNPGPEDCFARLGRLATWRAMGCWMGEKAMGAMGAMGA